ncbi:ATP-binding protein [Burkholderiaceae bacterium UC74_6]
MLLDRALEAAIAEFESSFDRPPAQASFRGLFVTSDDAAQLLRQAPGHSAWSVPAAGADRPRFLPGDETSRLALLKSRFELDAFETDALLIAISPDLDHRYERLFGLLQDDVTRRRPTLATIAHLASAYPVPQWEGVGRLLSGSSALLSNRLVRVLADTAQAHATWGSHYLVPDPQVVAFLAGRDTLDLSLQAVSELHTPGHWNHFEAIWHRHPAVAPLLRCPDLHCLRLLGATSAERLHLAHAIASRLGLGLLRLRLDRVEAHARSALQELARAQLAARLHDAILLVEEADASPPADTVALVEAACGRLCMVSSFGADERCRMPRLDVSLPPLSERRARWQARLGRAGRNAATHDLTELAQVFQLDSQQTDDAAARACAVSAGRTVPRDALFAAARSTLSLRVPRALNVIEPRSSWEHLALTADVESQLREIGAHVRERTKVLTEWGFGQASSRGRGVSALFSGTSGTGKSTACEALAGELGRSLFRLDLSQAISKYIGESEKHLAEVFDVAERTDAVLLFDEADALFGKRTSVSDAHDRYANMQVSYLLQRMEAFSGILVLTTNLQINIDAAFLRRLQFIVEFSFPDEAQRERIWSVSLPPQAPRDPDLDFRTLAQRYAVAGGSIRNIALSAAMLAASRGESIAMRHMSHGALREYQKLGKALPEGDHFANGAPR